MSILVQPEFAADYTDGIEQKDAEAAERNPFNPVHPVRNFDRIYGMIEIKHRQNEKARRVARLRSSLKLRPDKLDG